MSNYKAGPELDDRVATEVMGWRKIDVRGESLWADADGRWMFRVANTAGPLKDWWHPSTDLAQAWMVLEKIAGAGWMVSIEINAVGGFVSMTKFNEKNDQIVIVVGGAIPRSICSAAEDAKAA